MQNQARVENGICQWIRKRWTLEAVVGGRRRKKPEPGKTWSKVAPFLTPQPPSQLRDRLPGRGRSYC